MEIRNYLKTIWRHIWWLIIPVVVIVLLTLIFTLIYRESYYVPVAFSVNRVSQEEIEGQYQYDGYYAIEANRNLGAQFASWLKGASFRVEIYSRADLEEEDSFLSTEMKIVQRSHANTEMQFYSADKNRLSKLATAAIETIDANKKSFEGEGKDQIAKVNVPTDFNIGTRKAPLVKNLLSALGVGIVIGLIFVYLRAIFIKENQASQQS